MQLFRFAAAFTLCVCGATVSFAQSSLANPVLKSFPERAAICAHSDLALRGDPTKEERLARCLGDWDSSTHMTKIEWRRAHPPMHPGWRLPSVVQAKDNGGSATCWRAKRDGRPLWCANLGCAIVALLSARTAAAEPNTKAVAKYAMVSFDLVASIDLPADFMVVSLDDEPGKLHKAPHNKEDSEGS